MCAWPSCSAGYGHAKPEQHGQQGACQHEHCLMRYPVQVAAKYSHQAVETEHLLAAMLEQSNGLARRILQKAEADPSTMLERVDSHLRGLPKVSGHNDQVRHVIQRPSAAVLDWFNRRFAAILPTLYVRMSPVHHECPFSPRRVCTTHTYGQPCCWHAI